MRRAEQLALEIVGPAMDRADEMEDVAATLQHDRLPVAADVRDEFDALRVAHERLRVVSAFERAVVADIGHHQLVPDIAGCAREQQPLFGGVERGVAVR